MRKIAVLLTCFNRRDKTINSLKNLHAAYNASLNEFDIDIYLTDDGSSDGTSEAVQIEFPEVKIFQGTGDLFWAGGMRNSWGEALKYDYDGYLLLNDDTNVKPTLFDELLDTHSYCMKNYDQPGIYVGSTSDADSGNLSYGGAVFTNKFLAKYTKLPPNGEEPQLCELGNANIMCVHQRVVDKIGILSKGFRHGLADYDYTYTASKNGIPVLITPNILGSCKNDHPDFYQSFPKKNLKERIKTLYNPLGLDFKSNLFFMRKNFPLRLPVVFIAGWAKVLFPVLYNKLNRYR